MIRGSTTSLWASLKFMKSLNFIKFLHVLHWPLGRHAHETAVATPFQGLFDPPPNPPIDPTSSHLFGPSNTSSHLQGDSLQWLWQLAMYYVWIMSSFSHWNSHVFQAFPAICADINVGKLRCERSFTESSLRFGANVEELLRETKKCVAYRKITQL
jgi:hypothetical protein